MEKDRWHPAYLELLDQLFLSWDFALGSFPELAQIAIVLLQNKLGGLAQPL